MKALVKLVIISLFLTGVITPVFSQQGEKLFQEAMMKEEGEGNIKEAIDIYSRLVEDNSMDRKIRAKALFQVGICYEKLGQNKAASAFEKLISEYGDQKDLITVARRKLRSMKGSKSPVIQGLVSKRIQKNISTARILNSVSPDGRYYSFFESTPRSENDNTIVVHDLVTDKMTSVTEFVQGVPGSKKNSIAWNSVWSPDGKRLAYDYTNDIDDDGTKQEVHLVNADGSNKKVIYSNDKAKRLGVWHFSPDGKKVLLSILTSNDDHNLMEVDISTGQSKIVKVFDPEANALNFKYAPNGPFIVFTIMNNIHTLNTVSGQIEQVTSYDGMDSSPHWNLKGDKLLFISDRQGSNDLYYIEMSNGKPVGSAKALQRKLGEGAAILGMDKNGSVYVKASNSRTDIYTLGFSNEMDIILDSKKRITMPNADNSNGLARFSKDGKYISYQSKLVKMSDGLRSDVNSKYNGFDEELGYKYSIHIYNSETDKTKLLDLPLYLNHYPRSQAWMVPTWSYQGNKLLVHGRIRENFEGGFFMVDVEKETVTPALTKPNCKLGMPWNEVEVGNSMFFSRDKDIIYYSTPGWKKAMKYNIKTGESTELASIEAGFWFEGFNDIEETQLRGANTPLGAFMYDINTHQIKKLAERSSGQPRQFFENKTKGFKMYDLEGRVVFQDVSSQNKINKVLRLVLDSGETKEFNLSEIFPDCLIRFADYEPGKKQLLMSVIKDPGNEIYKISNLFD